MDMFSLSEIEILLSVFSYPFHNVHMEIQCTIVILNCFVSFGLSNLISSGLRITKICMCVMFSWCVCYVFYYRFMYSRKMF